MFISAPSKVRVFPFASQCFSMCRDEHNHTLPFNGGLAPLDGMFLISLLLSIFTGPDGYGVSLLHPPLLAPDSSCWPLSPAKNNSSHGATSRSRRSLSRRLAHGLEFFAATPSHVAPPVTSVRRYPGSTPHRYKTIENVR